MRAILLIAVSVAGAVAADVAPQWLRDQAAIQVPAQGPKVPAVVLLTEKITTVEETGRVIERTRRAVRILNNEGRDEAIALESYAVGGGRIREMQAWLISPSGETIRYGKDRVVESSFDGMSMYNDSRTARIVASIDAAPGSVFGFETTTEEKPFVAQLSWEFQDNLPTLSSRFQLSLPAGWQAKPVALRGAEEKSSGDGVLLWEMKNLPFIDDERSAGSIRGSVPRIAVNYFPPAGSAAPIRTIRDWNDAGSWMAELADPQSKADAAITAKVQELTAGAADEFARIRAIGQYTQRIRYIAIQTGLAKGGGYKPHPAAEVFAKSYGDCKDKAALTRAMLGVLGMTTYDVSIFSGDRTYVDPNWPSPRQFNHAILAVKVSDAVQAPAAGTVEGIGKVLFFDPTDEATPAGNLPIHLQGSFALIGLEKGGKLVQVPVAPPSANRIERTIQFAVTPDGSINGKVSETHHGSVAGRARRTHDELGKEGYTKYIEKWVSSSAQFATVQGIDAGFRPESGEFALQFTLASERYARKMNPRMMLLRPTAVIRQIGPNTNEATRMRPVILDSQSMTEIVTIDLPEGFHVDEAPDEVRLEKPFGLFTSKFEASAGKLTVRRTIELRHVKVEPAAYAELRDFMGIVRGNQAAPVVLVKK